MCKLFKSPKIIILFVTIILFLGILNKSKFMSNGESPNTSTINTLQSTIEKDLDKDNQDELQAIKFMSDLIKLTKQNKLEWELRFNEMLDAAIYECCLTKNSKVTIFCKENSFNNWVRILIDTNMRTTNIYINLPKEYRKNDIPKFTEYLKKRYNKETEMRFKNERTGDDNINTQFDNLINTISKKH